MPLPPRSRIAAPLHRAVAVLLAAVVVLLLVVAQRPDWHARLHAAPLGDTSAHAGCDHAHHQGARDDQAPPTCEDAGCALTVFAQGHLATMVAQLATAPDLGATEATRRLPAAPVFAAADRRLPHGCGPPRA